MPKFIFVILRVAVTLLFVVDSVCWLLLIFVVRRFVCLFVCLVFVGVTIMVLFVLCFVLFCCCYMLFIGVVNQCYCG